MSRKRKAPTRIFLKDAKYKSDLILKLMNSIMYDGKKSVAEKIVYGAFDRIDQTVKSDPVELFKKALESIGPMVEVKSRRVGGATYQVPIEVRPSRRQALAMRWLVEAARKRSEKSMDHRLAGELADAAEGKGSAVKKKEDIHRMAEANKAFSHFRF